MATHLELVNEVLKRLRESEVGTISGNYPKLISTFVNRAKVWTEKKHDWQTLRMEETVTTSAGIAEYEIPNTKKNTRLFMEWDDGRLMYMPIVWNNTQGSRGRVLQKPLFRWTTARKSDTIQTGEPGHFVVTGRASTGEMKVGLINEPDGVYSIDFTFVDPEATLVEDDDETNLPEDVLVDYAYYLAVAERGEDGGQGSREELGIAKETLQEFISLEASWGDGEFICRAE